MAQFENMFEVNLDNRSYPVALNQTVSEGNVNSNRIGAYVYKDGQPYNLGGACTGLVMRADGTTVPMTGVIDGNAAYVVLNQESCAIPGPIQVAVSWVSGNNTTTLIVAYGTVITTDTRSYVQSGPIADVNTLLGYIGDVEQAAADAAESASTAAEQAEIAQNKCVRFDTAQSLTTTQKAQARGNIDAAGTAQVVRVDAAQTLTSAQKATARGNIDVPSNADLDDVKTGMAVRYDVTQSLTDTQKATARGNIDAPSNADLNEVKTGMAVRYDVTQNLTDTQMETARENINAAGLAQVVRVDAAQSLTDTQKATARGNIDAAGIDFADMLSVKTGGEYNAVTLTDITNGKYIRNVDGNVSSSTAWDCSGYMPVSSGKLLFTCPQSTNESAVSIIAAVAFYSGTNVASFISSTPIKTGTIGKTQWAIIDIPGDAKYMRVTIAAGKESAYQCYNMTFGLRGTFGSVASLGINDADKLLYNKIYIRSNTSQALAHIPYDNWLGAIITLSYSETFTSGAFQLALSSLGEMHMRRAWGTSAAWGDWTEITNDTAAARIADYQNGIVGMFSGAFTSDAQYVYVPITLQPNTQYVVRFEGQRTGTVTVAARNNATAYKFLRPYMDEVTITNGETEGDFYLYNLNGTRDALVLTVYEADKLSNRRYVVAKNEHEGDYTSFTQCLIDLENDRSRKTIEIWEGDYDIYQEYVDAGVPVYTGDNPSADYYDYCVWVPTNTRIIGMGRVRLMWMPTIANTSITVGQSKTVSPLNVGGSVEIENLEVHCKNGRYCLHNDSSGKAYYGGAIQHYRNVKFIHYANETLNGVALGFTHTTGFGIDRSMQHIYDDCVFLNEAQGRAFYGHGRGTVGGAALTLAMSSSIVLNNCAIKTNGDRGVKFGNGNFSMDIRVLLANCDIDGLIAITNETESVQTVYPNSFDVTLLNCGDVSMYIQDTNNPYPPKAYRTNLTLS